MDQVGGRIPVYVGVGDTGLSPDAGSVGSARRRRAPTTSSSRRRFYYPVASEARIVEYFVAVAERAAAPIVLYNIPQNTHLPLAPSAVRDAWPGIRTIVGIKDSAGDWFAFEQFLALRSDDFSVMQGREHLAAISLWSGADGLISAMANFAPRLLQGLAASVHDERPRTETLALQATVGELAAVFDQGYWLAGLKATLQAWAGTSASRARRSRATTPISAGSSTSIVAAPGHAPLADDASGRRAIAAVPALD